MFFKHKKGTLNILFLMPFWITLEDHVHSEHLTEDEDINYTY